ncbi:MAG: LCP family protein, partial [Oscillospiraceae bacterium]|nr:LCP family protein [Oscillospiraceae bacterium]
NPPFDTDIKKPNAAHDNLSPNLKKYIDMFDDIEREEPRETKENKPSADETEPAGVPEDEAETTQTPEEDEAEATAQAPEAPTSEAIVDEAEPNEDIKGEEPQDQSKAGLRQSFVDFWTSKDNRAQKIAIIILCIIFIAILAMGIYVFAKMSLIGTNDDKNTYEESELEEEINVSMMDDITDAKSLNGLLKAWYNNGGEKMSSKNIINILLLGIDSESNLADTMILMSLNKKTQKISLVSLYRDSYTYFKTASGKEYYAKLNAAYSAGGAACTVDAIENIYKIKIDHYISADYKGFTGAVNSLGGITLKVEPYEASYLNRKYGLNVKSGQTTLKGKEALLYSRIRHSDNDADISRARRNRAVIIAVMNKMKNASLSQMDKMATQLLPQVKTSLSKTQILGYGAQAVTQGWMQYGTKQTAVPTPETSSSGHIGDQWVFIVDYPGAAYYLQNFIYGSSNIKLKDGRVSALDLKPKTPTTRNNNSHASATEGTGTTDSGTFDTVPSDTTTSTTLSTNPSFTWPSFKPPTTGGSIE